jgi:hypothetical protein
MGDLAAKLRERKALDLIGNCVKDGYPLSECEQAVKNAEQEIKARASKPVEEMPAGKLQGGIGIEILWFSSEEKKKKDTYELKPAPDHSSIAKAKKDEELRAFLKIRRCWGDRPDGSSPSCQLEPEQDLQLHLQPENRRHFSIDLLKDLLLRNPLIIKDFVLPQIPEKRPECRHRWRWDMPEVFVPEHKFPGHFNMPEVDAQQQKFPWHFNLPNIDVPECEPEKDFGLPRFPRPFWGIPEDEKPQPLNPFERRCPRWWEDLHAEYMPLRPLFEREEVCPSAPRARFIHSPDVGEFEW